MQRALSPSEKDETYLSMNTSSMDMTGNKLWFTNVTIASSISIISSSLIIIAIFRSPRRWGTIYHRIMLGMSSMDILTSLAMVFKTLPVPKTEDIYNLEMASGTQGTCNAQGFTLFMGLTGSLCYVCGLTLYYFCRIQLRMRDGNIMRKGIEICIHSLSIVFSVSVAIGPLFLDLYNPAPFTPWCTIAIYPLNGVRNDQGEQIERIRGNERGNEAYNIVKIIIMSVTVIFVTACLGSIVWNRKWYSLEREYYDPNIIRRPQHLVADHVRFEAEIRKELVQQSFMYELAFVIVWIFLPLKTVFPENDVISALMYTFLPLQGFFNALIFIYHKISTIRKSRNGGPNISVLKALHGIFITPSEKREEDIRIIGLSIVNRDLEENGDECAVSPELPPWLQPAPESSSSGRENRGEEGNNDAQTIIIESDLPELSLFTVRKQLKKNAILAHHFGKHSLGKKSSDNWSKSHLERLGSDKVGESNCSGDWKNVSGFSHVSADNDDVSAEDKNGDLDFRELLKHTRSTSSSSTQNQNLPEEDETPSTADISSPTENDNGV